MSFSFVALNAGNGLVGVVINVNEILDISWVRDPDMHRLEVIIMYKSGEEKVLEGFTAEEIQPLYDALLMKG